jgi:hypothetical protein
MAYAIFSGGKKHSQKLKFWECLRACPAALLPGGSKKRPAANQGLTPGSTPAMPLRHIGNIEIWEGNYKSDI